METLKQIKSHHKYLVVESSILEVEDPGRYIGVAGLFQKGAVFTVLNVNQHGILANWGGNQYGLTQYLERSVVNRLKLLDITHQKLGNVLF